MDGQERYLQNLVRSASPTRLRLLLIERAIEVADSLAAGAKPGAKGKRSSEFTVKSPELVRGEQALRLRDIFGELLSGVVEKDPLAKQVADLYVFLLQYLDEAERDNKPQQWECIASILRLEQETWAQVCERSTPSGQPHVERSAPPAPAPLGHLALSTPPQAGSINLQG